MLRCAFSINRVAEHLGRIYDLSAREVLAIMELAIGGPCSSTELANRLYVSRSAMTSMVRRLEGSGWISSSKDTDDRRRLVLDATERPRQLLSVWNRWFEHGPTTAVLSSDADAMQRCIDELDLHLQWLRQLGPAEVRALSQRRA